MANATGFQKRIAQLSTSESAEYVVDTYMEDAGTYLTDLGVFLMEILDTNDPNRDTLARVSTIADYTEFGTDRITAVANNQRFYRSSAASVVYDSIEVALAAAQMIEGNVNTLVTDFETYLTDFDTSAIAGPPAQYEALSWPMTTDTEKERLVAEYTAAKQNRIDQEAVVATKTIECQTLATELSLLEDQLTAFNAMVDAANGLTSSISTVQPKLKTSLDASSTFHGKAQAATTAYQADEANSRLLQAQVSAQGSSYATGETFEIQGGTFTTKATGRVTRQSGGAVEEVEITVHGVYSDISAIPNPVLTENASASGNNALTLTPEWATIIDSEATNSYPLSKAGGTMDGDLVTHTAALGDGYGAYSELAIAADVATTAETNIVNQRDSAETERDTTKNESETCANELANEQTTLDEYEIIEDQKKDALLTYCPDFDTDSV